MGISPLRNAIAAVLKANAGELLLVLGLGLIAVSLWPSLGRMALLPVGVVLLWIALPARTSFVARPPLDDKPSRRTI